MKVANLCKKLINEIILDYDLMIPRLTNSSRIDSSVLLEVFKAVVPADAFESLNGQNNQSSVYECMLTSLSQSLYIDLNHISAENLAQGDLKHILALLEILIAIKRFVNGKSDRDARDERLDATFTIEQDKYEVEADPLSGRKSCESASGSESCSLCYCHQANVRKCSRAAEREAKSDNENGRCKVRKSRSPHHRYVDARRKKNLLLTGKREGKSSTSATACSSVSCCSSHQLAKRLDQVLHLNEEVQCAEEQVPSTECTTCVSPDLIVNPCTLSPGTKIQLERLFKSHRAFQRNIRVQVEKVDDSRRLVSQQLSMHSKTGNVNATGESNGSDGVQETPVSQRANLLMHHNCTHQGERNTSLVMSCVNPSLYTGNNYQRDLRSRLARLTREIRERERQLTSKKLKTQNDIQRTIVKCAKSQVNRSKKELMAAREYVLQRNLQQMKRDQLYLQSLDQLFDDRTHLLCTRAVERASRSKVF